MKIAVYHNLPEGGARRVLGQIEEYFEKNDHSISFYCIGEKIYYQPKKRITSTFIKISPWKGFILRNFWIFFKLGKIHSKLANEIDKEKFDLVVVHHDYLTKSPFLLRYLKTKSLYFCHEPQREFYEHWSIHSPSIKQMIANIIRYPIKIIDEGNVKKANIIIANSRYSQKVIRKIYGMKSTLLYPSVDTKKFKPTIQKTNRILFVGSINKIKDPYFVLEAVLPLLGKYTLLIIGSGKSYEIKKLMILAGNKTKYIKMVNNISDQELINYYSSSIVLCIGAHYEPFGLTSIEAQACGTPVVAVKEGGVSETIINGKTGYLTSRSTGEFKEYVSKLLKIKSCQECVRNSSLWNAENWERKFANIVEKT